MPKSKIALNVIILGFNFTFESCLTWKSGQLIKSWFAKKIVIAIGTEYQESKQWLVIWQDWIKIWKMLAELKNWKGTWFCKVWNIVSNSCFIHLLKEHISNVALYISCEVFPIGSIVKTIDLEPTHPFMKGLVWSREQKTTSSFHSDQGAHRKLKVNFKFFSEWKANVIENLESKHCQRHQDRSAEETFFSY